MAEPPDDETPPVVLVVAGTDSGGGAGLAADLRTLARLGVHGCLAVTAVTAQDTTGVHRAEPVDADLLDDQVRVVLADLPVRAVKTGLVPRPAQAARLGERLRASGLAVVVDPVLADRHGRPLAGEELVVAHRAHLLPVAAVVTPNLAEAALLTGRDPITDVEGMERAALSLAGEVAGAVVVTGGALGGEVVVDVSVIDGVLGRSERPRITTGNDHGSGDTLSTAIAAGLAGGLEPAEAIERATRLVADALAGAAGWSLGAGHGPLDQLGFTRLRR